jgi:sulfur dioxygenase
MKTHSFNKDGIPTIDPKHVSDLTNIEIIDVRTPEEYTAELGHIENSTLTTLGPELTNFLSRADKDKQYIFVCRSGVRSGRATQEALTSGFTNVLNMDGGMMKWNELELPTKF